jgi:membrane protein implicated in regulation of membrane protease activity
MLGNSSLEGLYIIGIVWIVVAASIVIVSILAIVALVFAIRVMSRKLKEQDAQFARRTTTGRR